MPVCGSSRALRRVGTALGRALTLILVVAACAPAPDADAGGTVVNAWGLSIPRYSMPERLHLFTWPDYMDPALLDRFREVYGTRVIVDYYDNNEAMLAKLRSGGLGQYDVVIASDYAVESLIAADLLDPLDADSIPNRRNLDPRFRAMPFDPQDRFAVAYQWGTSGLGIRNDLAEGGPRQIFETWMLVFDPGSAVGPIAMLADARETIGAALIYLGFSPNTTDSAEIAQAERLLIEQRPRVATYAGFTTGRDLLASGDIVVAHNYSGDVMMARDEVPGIRFVIPREGALVWSDNMVVPKRAPHRRAAIAFINFVLDAEIGARLSNFTRYASPNAAARELIDAELLADPAIYPDSALMARLHFLRDVGPARRLYDRAWTRIRAGAAATP